jgi:hypothetical protein
MLAIKLELGCRDFPVRLAAEVEHLEKPSDERSDGCLKLDIVPVTILWDTDTCVKLTTSARRLELRSP